MGRGAVGEKIVVAATEGISIRTQRDISKALGAAIGTKGLLLTENELGDDFFNLRTGIAGELFQKFINYNTRIAMAISEPERHGERFAELTREHATHPLIRWFISDAEALNWLEVTTEQL